MGSVLKLRYSTQEGLRLFHVAARLDRDIRKLKKSALSNDYKATRIVQITNESEKCIERFIAFLDYSFVPFRPNSPEAQLVPNQRLNYRKILSQIDVTIEEPKKVVVHNNFLIPLFTSIKTTDVLIRLAEEFGLQHYDKYVQFRKLFNQQIDMIETFQQRVRNASNSFHRMKKPGANNGIRNSR